MAARCSWSAAAWGRRGGCRRQQQQLQGARAHRGQSCGGTARSGIPGHTCSRWHESRCVRQQGRGLALVCCKAASAPALASPTVHGCLPRPGCPPLPAVRHSLAGARVYRGMGQHHLPARRSRAGRSRARAGTGGVRRGRALDSRARRHKHRRGQQARQRGGVHFEQFWGCPAHACGSLPASSPACRSNDSRATLAPVALPCTLSPQILAWLGALRHGALPLERQLLERRRRRRGPAAQAILARLLRRARAAAAAFFLACLTARLRACLLAWDLLAWPNLASSATKVGAICLLLPPSCSYGCVPPPLVAETLAHINSTGDAVVFNAGPHCLRSMGLVSWSSVVAAYAA